jgi:hypothetical protein
MLDQGTMQILDENSEEGSKLSERDEKKEIWRRGMFPGKFHIITASSINMGCRTCPPYRTTAGKLQRQEYGGRRLLEMHFWLMGCDFLRKASEIRKYRFIRDILIRNLVDWKDGLVLSPRIQICTSGPLHAQNLSTLPKSKQRRRCITTEL